MIFIYQCLNETIPKIEKVDKITLQLKFEDNSKSKKNEIKKI